MAKQKKGPWDKGQIKQFVKRARAEVGGGWAYLVPDIRADVIRSRVLGIIQCQARESIPIDDIDWLTIAMLEEAGLAEREGCTPGRLTLAGVPVRQRRDDAETEAYAVENRSHDGNGDWTPWVNAGDGNGGCEPSYPTKAQAWAVVKAFRDAEHEDDTPTGVARAYDEYRVVPFADRLKKEATSQDRYTVETLTVDGDWTGEVFPGKVETFANLTECREFISYTRTCGGDFAKGAYRVVVDLAEGRAPPMPPLAE